MKSRALYSFIDSGRLASIEVDVRPNEDGTVDVLLETGDPRITGVPLSLEPRDGHCSPVEYAAAAEEAAAEEAAAKAAAEEAAAKAAAEEAAAKAAAEEAAAKAAAEEAAAKAKSKK